MTLWNKIHLLARYNDLMKRDDVKFMAETVDGLQGTGKLNDEQITDYLEAWKIHKLNVIFSRYELKIMNKIYDAM